MEEIKEILLQFEKLLNQYEIELKKNPNSSFFQGLVKNTKEYIEELKETKK